MKPRKPINKVSAKQKARLIIRRINKAAARKRDGHRCRVCGAAAFAVHHVIPLGRGGSDEIDNLITLCDWAGCFAHQRAHLLQSPYLYIRHDGQDFQFSENKFEVNE